MNNISMVILCLSFLYSISLNILYFTKKHIKTYETKIFSIMMVSNLIGIVLEFCCIFSIHFFGTGNLLVIIINRIFLLYLLLFAILFAMYATYLTIFEGTKEKLSKKQNNIRTIYLIAYVFFGILVLILPFNIYSKNEIMYSNGPAANIVYFIAIICTLLCLTMMTIKFKTIKRNKTITLFVYIFGGGITSLIQQINPALTLATSMETFIIFLMYHTIENPDMKLIAQLNEARDQAEKANNAKSEFLSNMSHEIRTPLNAIVGFSQALLEEDINNNAKEEVKDIVSASSSLLEIVNGILDISKIESGKLEIVNTEYNLNNILNDLVALTKARMGEKPLEFRTNFDPTIPSVLYGDHVRVKQIILNLLTNAVKYTKEGYIEFKVSTVRKDDIIRLIISVEDSGIGIKEDKIDKLFSKFERLDIEKNNTIEGTGLGLAITKRLIELMNGKIVVQSVYGKGSRFTVAIDQKIISDAPLKEEKITVSDEIIDCSSKKVLIVDDNKLNLKVASRLLEKYKCDIETIDNGLEAIELIKKNKYDLILLDDMMPKLSGTETLLKLKEIDSFDIPVVALTANAITGMKEKYLKAGFNDYLSKPIDKTELNRIINEFLK